MINFSPLCPLLFCLQKYFLGDLRAVVSSTDWSPIDILYMFKGHSVKKKTILGLIYYNLISSFSDVNKEYSQTESGDSPKSD